LIITFLAVALLGLAIGVLSGMFGVGGGAMMVPFLHLVFAMPMLNASSTSLFAVAPTSLAGAVGHLRRGTVDVRAALSFGLPGALASALSAFLTNMLSENVILVAAVLVIAYCAWRVFAEALKKPIDAEGRTSANRIANPRLNLLVCIGIGLLAGFIAGIVGVGGGFIIVPFGIGLLGKTMKEMSAISLLAIACIALPGIIVHAILLHIWYFYGIAMIVGTIPGASIGVWLLPRIPERILRYAYGCLLVFSGIMLIVNKVAFKA